MYSTYLLLALSSLASAFPAGFTLEHLKAVENRGLELPNDLAQRDPDFARVINMVEKTIADRRANQPEATVLTRRQGLLNTESQCGASPCPTFNEAEQFVNVAPGSANEYIAPGPNDKRGPCPGLNAAANHGFLPRNGIPNIEQTITGLGQAYGMSVDLAGFLATYAVVFNGDPGALTWSIGGSYPASLLSGLLGGRPGGISNSHNNYESDSSVTRFDAYLNNGNAVALNMTAFKRMLSNKNAEDLYTINSLQVQAIESRENSINNNPYFFSSPFAGVAVAPVAHYFIVRMMSNHTAENPDGYLDAAMLKSFFAVQGEGDALTWYFGTEQIPQNWYRRPLSSPYSIPAAVVDIVAGGLKYPALLTIGGNTGKANSFVGVDPADLTKGVYSADTITEGNNLGCLIFQTIQIGAPDILAGLLANTAKALGLLSGVLNPIIGELACPALDQYDQSLFNQFPGASYKPSILSKRVYRL